MSPFSPITHLGAFTNATRDIINSNFALIGDGLLPSGRTYYVDILRGADTNDGLTMDTPFKQVTAAVTASEAYRTAGANPYAINPYGVRNRIYVFGALNTPYDGLTTLPNYTDVIGVGASYLRDMSGTAVLGTDTTKNGSATAEMRGSNFTNLQFRGGGSNNSALLALKVLGCRFYECFFRCGASGDAGIHIYTAGTGAGNIFQQCKVGYGANGTYGFYIHETNNWDTCLIEGCWISGGTTGYYTAAYLQNQTVVRNNTIVCTSTSGYAIQDISSETTLAGNAYYVNNFCQGGSGTTDPASVIAVTNNPAKRCIGNTVVTTNASYRYYGTTAL
jgi:hypothetical protein